MRRFELDPLRETLGSQAGLDEIEGTDEDPSVDEHEHVTFQLTRKTSVLDEDASLEIRTQRTVREVGRADQRSPAVDHEQLRVEERTGVPLLGWPAPATH